MEPYLLNRLVRPFWLSDTMEQESVCFVQVGDDLPDAPLLFQPTKIIDVRDATLDKTHIESRDWICRGDRLVLPEGSRIFHFHHSELRPFSAPPAAGMFPGRDGKAGVLYAEGDYFHLRQAVVTYEHAGSGRDGSCPVFQGSQLPFALSRLRNDHALKLTLFGDSISVGANSSSLSNAPPFLPTWGELVKLKLEDHYDATLQYHNPSEGGRDTTWGLSEIETRVASSHPDLVILAFGMNDGTGRLGADGFRANLTAMMEMVSRQNPAAEFLLVAPMLANPESNFDGCQSDYGNVVRSLTRTGVAAVDMGWLHSALLQKKRYVDLTGNNINHPNDFLTRCYAMAVLSTLIDIR
jgi:lysophospholipase L1-like esterase